MSASQRARQQDAPDDRESSVDGPNGGSNDQSHSGTSPLEWTIAGFCALLVLGAIAYLLYEALGEPSTPPEIHVTVEAVRSLQSGYLVEFRAENRGHTTAAGVGVEGMLKRGTETVEMASATFDYVPAEGSRRGGLYFTEDPRAYVLEIRPTGFDRP